jgi:hypothetical protein
MECGTRQLTVFGSVHFGLFGLCLLDGFEELCVDALSAGLLDGAEYSSAQLCVVRLLAACACAFRHCDVMCWVVVYVLVCFASCSAGVMVVVLRLGIKVKLLQLIINSTREGKKVRRGIILSGGRSGPSRAGRAGYRLLARASVLVPVRVA